MRYAENDEKTIYKNEKTMHVTGVNCKAKTAYEEMVTVQNRFDKTQEMLHITHTKVLKQEKFRQN